MVIATVIEQAFWDAVDPRLPEEVKRLISDSTIRIAEDNRRALGDYPALGLVFRPIGPIDSPVRTFGMNTLTGARSIDHVMRIRVIADIVFKTQEPDTANKALMAEAVAAGLTDVWPTLGITEFPVSNFTVGTANRARSAPGMTVEVVNVPLTVDCRPRRSQVVAA